MLKVKTQRTEKRFGQRHFLKKKIIIILNQNLRFALLKMANNL